jgi:hypothetical protein
MPATMFRKPVKPAFALLPRAPAQLHPITEFAKAVEDARIQSDKIGLTPNRLGELEKKRTLAERAAEPLMRREQPLSPSEQSLVRAYAANTHLLNALRRRTA